MDLDTLGGYCVAHCVHVLLSTCPVTCCIAFTSILNLNHICADNQDHFKPLSLSPASMITSVQSYNVHESQQYVRNLHTPVNWAILNLLQTFGPGIMHRDSFSRFSTYQAFCQLLAELLVGCPFMLSI